MRRFSTLCLLASPALALGILALNVNDLQAQSGSRNVAPTASSNVYSPPSAYVAPQPTPAVNGGVATGAIALAYADPGVTNPGYAAPAYQAPSYQAPAYPAPDYAAGSPSGNGCGCGTPSCGGPAIWPTLPRCAPATGRNFFERGTILNNRPFRSQPSGCNSCGY